MRIIILVSFLSFVFKVSSQPCFEALDTIGCAPFEVELINCAQDNTDFYIFEDEIITNQQSHTYVNAGEYTITQYIGVLDVDTLIKENYITVLDNPDPLFETQLCEGREVIVNILNNDYDQYIVTYVNGLENDTLTGNGSVSNIFPDTLTTTISVKGIYFEATCFNEITTQVSPYDELPVPGITEATTNINGISIDFETDPRVNYQLFYGSLGNGFNNSLNRFRATGSDTVSIIPNLNPSDSTYLTYIASSDFCNNTEVSPVVGSIFLEGVSTNNLINLTWTPYPLDTTFSSYSLERNDISISTVDTTYMDQSAICGNIYSYRTRITTNVLNTSNNPIIVSSNRIELEAFSTDTPEPIAGLLSSYDLDNNLILSWEAPAELNPATYFLLAQNTQDTIMEIDGNDTLGRLSSSMVNVDCFQLVYRDVCANESETLQAPTTCPIQLDVDQQPNYVLELNWSDFFAFENGVSNYFLNVFNEEEAFLQSIELGTDTTYIRNEAIEQSQTIILVVTGVDDFGNEVNSNAITLTQPSRIRIPTAFSPNGDGLNDDYTILSRFIESFELSIFNQEGVLVYEGNQDSPKWDGTQSDTALPEGVYFYAIEYLDETAEKQSKNGTVTLIK